MQVLGADQADAVMDLVQQCNVVSHAWEQQEAASRNGEAKNQGTISKAQAEAVQREYREALSALTELYIAAKNLQVADQVCVSAMARNLPSAVSGSLLSSAA